MITPTEKDIKRVLRIFEQWCYIDIRKYEKEISMLKYVITAERFLGVASVSRQEFEDACVVLEKSLGRWHDIKLERRGHK